MAASSAAASAPPRELFVPTELEARGLADQRHTLRTAELTPERAAGLLARGLQASLVDEALLHAFVTIIGQSLAPLSAAVPPCSVPVPA